MKTAVLASLLFISSLVNAQNWCPPGATWTYGSDAFGMFGYQQYSYVGDTILGGLIGHRIAGQGAMSYFGQTQVDYWTNPLSFITGLEGDVVKLWSNTQQSWDTLFWMGALPGDGWLRPSGLYGTWDPQDSVVVIDTSTVVVDGMPLRRWEMGQVWSGGITCTTMFTERLGWLLAFEPFPACLIIDGPTGLRCYSDEDISVSFFNFGCGSLVGTAEASGDVRIPVFPNPGNDQFELQLPDGAHTIALLDAAGRLLLHQRSKEARVVIRTDELQSGIYAVLTTSTNGTVTRTKWMKE